MFDVHGIWKNGTFKKVQAENFDKKYNLISKNISAVHILSLIHAKRPRKLYQNYRPKLGSSWKQIIRCITLSIVKYNKI